MRVGLVSSEVAPFAKTGGLADVSAALARSLDRAGHDVRVILPMYSRVRTGPWKLAPVPELQDVPLEFGTSSQSFSVSLAKLPKSEVDVYLVRCPPLFERDGLYTSDPDEHVRFAMLNRAAIAICQWTQWSPDVLHCNDWHTALIPLYLKAFFTWDELFRDTKTVLTIHNIAYQGVFPDDTLAEIGFDGERRLLHQEDLANHQVNFLKTGLMYADFLTTVSETYAQEIQGDELGMGLQDILRARRESLFGITNGVDYDEWSPDTDLLIPHPFDASDLTGKQGNKRDLLEEVGLPPIEAGRRVPAVGIVSRLTAQKGFELLSDSLPVFLQREDIRLVALGSGEEKYERYFEWLQKTYPKQVAFRKGYDNQLAHRIEAGCDLFLMPSRYEPCGLNQMYSLRYGTPPVVRRTGGLADTVQDFDPETREGTGFSFETFDAQSFCGAFERGLRTYQDPEAWNAVVANGMKKDFSWEHQAARYVDLYSRLT